MVLETSALFKALEWGQSVGLTRLPPQVQTEVEDVVLQQFQDPTLIRYVSV